VTVGAAGAVVYASAPPAAARAMANNEAAIRLRGECMAGIPGVGKRRILPPSAGAMPVVDVASPREQIRERREFHNTFLP
jgi:hypothetical protein